MPITYPSLGSLLFIQPSLASLDVIPSRPGSTTQNAFNNPKRLTTTLGEYIQCSRKCVSSTDIWTNQQTRSADTLHPIQETHLSPRGPREDSSNVLCATPRSFPPKPAQDADLGRTRHKGMITRPVRSTGVFEGQECRGVGILGSPEQKGGFADGDLLGEIWLQSGNAPGGSSYQGYISTWSWRADDVGT